MKQEEKIEMFKQFLKDNNCYKKFKVELYKLEKRKINIYLKEYSLYEDEYLLNAFTWSSTKQGHDYWGDTNIKWKDYLNATRQKKA